MSSATRMAIVAALAAVAAIATFGPGPLQAQTYSNNPYRPVPWPKPWQPDGLNGSIDFGATTGIYADPNTDHIWLATRCGRTPRYHTNQEGCVFKPDYDMVFKFDLDGNLVARFGRGNAGQAALHVRGRRGQRLGGRLRGRGRVRTHGGGGSRRK